MSKIFDILKKNLSLFLLLLFFDGFFFIIRITTSAENFPWELVTAIVIYFLEALCREQVEKREKGRLNNLENYLSRNDMIFGSKRKNSENFLDYRFPFIGIYGRETECKLLDEFMLSKTLEGKLQKRCLWSIIGYGGIGKSKLAFHVSLKYKKKKWKVLWINHITINDILKIENCEVDGKTLVVCDYAGAYTEQIAKLIDKLKLSENACVRFLLLDRVIFRECSQNWYEIFKLNCRKCHVDLRSIEFDSTPLQLKNSESSIDPYYPMLYDLAAHFQNPRKKSFKKPIHLSEREVKIIRDWLINNKWNESNGLTVLFLLIGNDCLQKKINGESFTMQDIDLSKISKKFIDHMKMLFFVRFDIDEKHQKNLTNLLAMSTIIGQNLSNVDLGYCNKYVDEIKKFYEDELEKQFVYNEFFNSVGPFTPDFIGEFFVANHFNKLDDDEKSDLTSFFIQHTSVFSEFLKRLMMDWIRHEETGMFFENLANCIQESTEKHVKDFAEEMLKIICDCISNRDKLWDVSFFPLYYKSVETLMATCLNDNVNQHLIRFYRKGLAYYEVHPSENKTEEFYKKIDELETAEALKRTNATSQQEGLV